MRRGSRLAIVLAGTMAAATAASQSRPPEKAAAVSRKELAVINLSGEIDGMSGRVLRQSQTIIGPSGTIPLHDHMDRPEILHVLAGRLTDHQGGEAKDYGPGESFAVGRSTKHWLENRGTEPVTFIATSILKQP